MTMASLLFSCFSNKTCAAFFGKLPRQKVEEVLGKLRLLLFGFCEKSFVKFRHFQTQIHQTLNIAEICPLADLITRGLSAGN